MDQYIGQMLDNRYEILERIGTGGMAVVYKAKCHRLNRLVAVKILKSDLTGDADFRRRFHDESQAVAMLSHPNIVSVYDVSRGGDVEYIVMELIDGITLKQYMERRGQLNWRESLHFMIQIMKGLSHAHSRGIVHRDIKPQNIMVLRDGSVKVTDFGIACLENSAQTLTQEALGSVHYISPEQARGDRTDARSDIYSAGVVFYEMLTGRLPFEGDSAVSVAIQHLSSIPLPPREINPDIPEQLELICMRAMAPDIQKRYPTADAMVADLDAFRKNPEVDLEYNLKDLQPEEPDEPTRYIRPVTDVARRQERHSPVPVRQEPRKGGAGKRIGIIVGAFAAALVLIVLLFRFILSSFSGPVTVDYTVPNILGYTVEQASELESVKDIFEIQVKGYKNSSEYEAGEIISQNPTAESIKKSTDGALIPISVYVSEGENTAVMPDLVNNEYRAATIKLQKSNLGIEVSIAEPIEEFSDIYAPGYVISTDPVKDTVLHEGDVITLTISKGAEIQPVTVPSFLNSHIDKAMELVDQLGLKCGKVDEVESDLPKGYVVSQDVDALSSVDPGTTINFEISRGETVTSQQISINLPQDRDTVTIVIEQDGREVCNKVVSCSMGTYTYELQGSGTSTVDIYFDGVLSDSREITFN
ncbi:Stk1 family PASTA domain-containing Ser/Thr kinase [Oscillibacter sp. MSJ-2]|uniref:non-specific serine/threonine protein kinase n=1 Tax=Dysosmobacter acutus TaxID=2841504 RepID=A0ABS6FAE2_9FIRM|nr:Stk1 family PASTA domain-containing Ser/Thr kinase [Dysosmobacter acutus]MBU5627263.1 Stk1 family PASTA domain-containing Ser/Thr kinase [Dysosmobacter acutus]